MRAAVGTGALPGDNVEEAPRATRLPPLDGARGEKRGRETWALTVRYFGPAFSGYAWQPDAPRPTVASVLQDALTPLLRGRSRIFLNAAGRTDAGVSALGQLVSFHSWQPLSEAEVQEAVRAAAAPAGSLHVAAACRVPRAFHAVRAAPTTPRPRRPHPRLTHTTAITSTSNPWVSTDVQRALAAVRVPAAAERRRDAARRGGGGGGDRRGARSTRRP